MERIKFRSDNSKEEVFAREVRRRVREYFTENSLSINGNYKLYFKTFIMLSAYLVPFILILVLPMHTLIALGLVVLMGIGEAGIGMSIMHDGAHGAYSPKKWVNDLAASSMFLLGSNTLNWKIQHNLKHHTYTNIYEHDNDISTKAVVRLSEHAPLKKYHRFQQIYAFPLYGLMTLIRLFGEIGVLIQYNKEGILRERKFNHNLELIRLIITKIIYLGVVIGLPLLFTDFSIWQILVGFAVLHFIAGMIMSTVFQLAHVVEGADQPLPHDHHTIHADWFVHQLNTTSDFGRNNGFLSWYIGGLDYQIEHHLFQNISHVHYPEVAKIVEATAKEYGYTYNLKPSIYHALASHYQRLKELGRKPIKQAV